MVQNFTTRTSKKRKPQNNGGKWQYDFLTALADEGIVEDACIFAQVSRTTVYKYRRENPDFAKEWDKAVVQSMGVLRDTAIRRAKEKSDVLLMFLLKAHDPIYRDKLELGLSPDIAALIPQLQQAAKAAGVELADLLQSNIEALRDGE